jgi:hypothetical protein
MSLPNVYPQGALITLDDTIVDPNANNQPVDDPTRTVTVWKPGGVLLVPTPVLTHVSTGHYQTVIQEDGHPGQWKYQFTGSLGSGPLNSFEVVPNPS